MQGGRVESAAPPDLQLRITRGAHTWFDPQVAMCRNGGAPGCAVDAVERTRRSEPTPQYTMLTKKRPGSTPDEAPTWLPRCENAAVGS